MFKYDFIAEYEKCNKSTELDTLKKFTLAQDLKEEEIFNIGCFCNLSNSLDADGFILSSQCVQFYKSTPFEGISVSALLEDLSRSVKINYETAVRPNTRIFVNSTKTCIELIAFYSYTNQYPVSFNLCRDSKRSGLYVRDAKNNTYSTEFDTRNKIIDYLWSVGLVATSTKNIKIAKEYNRKDIETAISLYNFYSTHDIKTSTAALWRDNINKVCNCIASTARWPGYKQLINQLKPELK